MTYLTSCLSNAPTVTIALCMCVTLTLCQEEPASQIESAIFKSLNGCEKAFYPGGPYDQFKAKSKAACAMRCLSDPACSSINMVTEFDDPSPEVYCLLFNSAAESCEGLVAESSWMYMRLTNYQGKNRDENTKEPKPPTTEPPDVESECSPWQMRYEITNNQESGDKPRFLQDLAQGASVRISLVLPRNGFYHRLTPIAFNIEHSSTNDENEDVIYFEFPPRYYTEHSKGIYNTYKEYIGVSTKGELSVRTYSTVNDQIGEHSVQLTAQFFTRMPSGIPTHIPDSYNSDSGISDLMAKLKEGFEFNVLLRDGTRTSMVQDRWSRLDEDGPIIGIVKYEGGLYSRGDPTYIDYPLGRQYRVVTTDGVVKDTIELAKVGRSVSSERSDRAQLWFANRCWHLAQYIPDDSAEYRITNVTYLYYMIAVGSKIRVQFAEDNTLTTKTIPRCMCDEDGCTAYFDDHPVLQEGVFDINPNETSYNKLIISEISQVTMQSYNPETTMTSYSVSHSVRWFVEPSPYTQIFYMEDGYVEFNTNALPSGVDLQMVIVDKHNKVTSLVIEEVVEVDAESGRYEFHTSTVSVFDPTERCQTQQATRSKLILSTTDDSLVMNAWSVDWQTNCAMFRPVPYHTVSVFASSL